jgi:chromosomal replication initiation ATPase DnaA
VFVAEETADALATFYSKAKLSPILGNDEFRVRVLGRRAKHIDMPELKCARTLPSLEEIVATTARHFGVRETEVWTSRRGRGVISPARSVAMYLCQRAGDMRLGEIADAFGLAGYASAGLTIRQIKGRIATAKGLAKQRNYIILDLTP